MSEEAVQRLYTMLLGGFGINLVITVLSIAASMKVILWRLKELERRVGVHNGLDTRLTTMEAKAEIWHRRKEDG